MPQLTALLPASGGNGKIADDRAYTVAAACVCDMNQNNAGFLGFLNLLGRRLRADRVEQAVAEQDAKRFAREV